MSGRSYLSIGDVLSLFREEFPDVTISKIRFLESQGLVDPERSPSGYRKFYEADVERLRWVLRQQREHFLPLKVIRDRLAAAGTGVPPDEGYDPIAEAASLEHELDARHNGGAQWEEHPGAGEPVSAGVRPLGAHAAGTHGAPGQVAGTTPTPGRSDGLDGEPHGREPGANGAAPPVRWGIGTAPDDEVAPDAPVVELHPGTGRAAGGGFGQVPLDSELDDVWAPADPVGNDDDAPAADPPVAGAAGERARPARPEAPAAAVPPARVAAAFGGPSAAGAVLSASVSGVSLTIDELCAATGLTPGQVASLESYGLVAPMAVAGGVYYDEEALTVAKLVVEFAHYGIEPRHLRLYRNAVDREVGLVEQVITPLLRQRNPEARQRAVESAADLVRLGQGLRASLVRAELRRHLGT